MSDVHPVVAIEACEDCEITHLEAPLARAISPSGGMGAFVSPRALALRGGSTEA